MMVMKTSKQVMAETGISRATLNNYISLGLLPRPTVAAPSSDNDTAPRIGFFQEEAITRISEIQRLKQMGMKMQAIVDHFDAPPAPAVFTTSSKSAATIPTEPSDRRVTPEANLETDIPDPVRGMNLSIENLPYPAYMLNNNFEVLWCNRPAANQIFAGKPDLDDEISNRNIFRLILEMSDHPEKWHDVLQFHMALAKKRNANESILSTFGAPHEGHSDLIRSLSENADNLPGHHIQRRPASYVAFGSDERHCDLYASFFREGIFIAYVPASNDTADFLQLMASRERVIRDLLKNRQPFLSEMAIVAVDIADLDRLNLSLSPQDYFKFMNDLWACNETLLRRYHGTMGKHPGDGIIAHFFPEPDSNFITNAIDYALELRETAAEMSRRWRQTNMAIDHVRLQIGIEIGTEWFGTFRSASNIEFRALGGATASALQIGQLAVNGGIIANKNVISALPVEDSNRLHYGIRRIDQDGSGFFAPRLFARASDLLPSEQKTEPHLIDAWSPHLAVTEIEGSDASIDHS